MVLAERTNSWLIPSPRPGAIGSTSSKTSATAVWDLVESCCFGQPFSMMCPFLQLVFPNQFGYDMYIYIIWYEIDMYIYIIYIRKHIHIHTFFYTPLFSHGGVSSQTYHGVPCPCKKIVRKFTPEPPGFGARSCVFNSYFQILFSEWWIIRID